MNNSLNIAVWNANGLSNHRQELISFLQNHHIDVMLISETHFTVKSYLKIPNYNIYDTKHPDGTAHGGSAIIIKSCIKHFELEKFKHDFIQATSVRIEDWTGPITISALYSPPKHKIISEQYLQYFDTLGHRFIAGGDYNAKHTQWGSKSITTKGRQLLKAMNIKKLIHLSTGLPTYWPTDKRKSPDLIDFCVAKGISHNYLDIEPSLDLSSDHSPIIVKICTTIIKNNQTNMLHNKKTNWETYKSTLNDVIKLNIPLKTKEDLDVAIKNLNSSIILAAKRATPTQSNKNKDIECPIEIKKMIENKRKLRKIWQTTRAPADKNKLNRASNELRTTLNVLKNSAIQNYLENLSPTEATDYSLWKATKKLKRPQQHIPPIKKNDGNWARNDAEKTIAFAEHLVNVFKPHAIIDQSEEESVIHKYLEAPYQLSPQIRYYSKFEIKATILNLKTKKAPGHDRITAKLIKELPDKCLLLITYIFNTILRLGYYPNEWKIAEIIMIHKPGKDPEYTESYRPISLIPIISKVFEKLLLKRLKPIITRENIIPDHQFGFREQHSTIEQVHRIVKKISNDLEEKRYCSAAFLDISQAFDKVWHEGLKFKLKKCLPHHFAMIINSYLTNRHFVVKYNESKTSLYPIASGVPQGSVIGPFLYLLYTADIPVSEETMIATYADDTALLSSHSDPDTASTLLQKSLDATSKWMKKWKIQANENKSTHVTFALRRGNCPPVSINGNVVPHSDHVKYLGMHLDRRLNWTKHILTKRKQLGLTLRKYYWLIGRTSKLSLTNKLNIYKAIIKPVWSYGIQMWGTASNSNIKIIERFQAKTLRIITDAPWYVPNEAIRRDLQLPTVKEVITLHYTKYFERLNSHPNTLATELNNPDNTRRLRRHNVTDLNDRFLDR